MDGGLAVRPRFPLQGGCITRRSKFGRSQARRWCAVRGPLCGTYGGDQQHTGSPGRGKQDDGAYRQARGTSVRTFYWARSTRGMPLRWYATRYASCYVARRAMWRAQHAAAILPASVWAQLRPRLLCGKLRHPASERVGAKRHRQAMQAHAGPQARLGWPQHGWLARSARRSAYRPRFARRSRRTCQCVATAGQRR